MENKPQQQQQSWSSSPSNKKNKLRNKILKITTKAAAAVTVTFQSPPPFSPKRTDNNSATATSASTSSRLKPIIISMIPHEARRKPRDGMEAQDPTSPKVSCIGQIKKNKNKNNNNSKHTTPNPKTDDNNNKEKEKQNSNAKKFHTMFFQTGKPKTGATKKNNNSPAATDNNAPPIGYMRRFASGRESFDWKAQIAPDEIRHRDCFSEDDRADQSEEEEEEEEEDDEILIPFSAPILGGIRSSGVDNLQPRKEINLWKRRTMAPPRPLQLNPVLTAK